MSGTLAEISQALLEVSAVAPLPAAEISQALLEVTAVAPLPAAEIIQALLEISVTIPSNPMLPTAVFPNLITSAAGAAWSVHRRPTNSTRVATAVSGREVRTPYYAVPLYEFELVYDQLNSSASPLGALSAQTLQALQGFFLQCQGQYAGFLFTDPENCQVISGRLGVGDGSTMVFPLLRTVGAYSEQVQAANVVSAVYINGVAQTGASWTVTNGNQIAFAAAPASGAMITADFSYYFVCRFLDDVHDYEEFMYQIHKLGSCKFRSVRVS